MLCNSYVNFNLKIVRVVLPEDTSRVVLVATQLVVGWREDVPVYACDCECAEPNYLENTQKTMSFMVC